MATIQASKHLLFPVQVWRFSNPDIDQSNRCRDYLLSLEGQTPGVKKTNQGGWQSDDQKIFDEKLSTLRGFFQQCLQGVLQQNRYREGSELILVNGWANINRRGHFNMPHVHGRCDWSMAYYFDGVGSEQGPIYFTDPVLERAANGATEYFVEQPSEEQLSIVEIHPSAGELIVFPSWLLHGVKPNHSTEPRITFSCNFCVRRKGASY